MFQMVMRTDKPKKRKEKKNHHFAILCTLYNDAQVSLHHSTNRCIQA